MTDKIEEKDLEKNEIDESIKLNIPLLTNKYKRPPVFQKQNNCLRINQNNSNNKPIIRKGAGRGR